MTAIERLWRRILAPVDGSLLSIALGLLALGILTLYSAAYDTPARMTAQGINILVALGVMWIVAQVPPQTLMRFAPPAYIIGLMLLLAVAAFGRIGRPIGHADGQVSLPRERPVRPHTEKRNVLGLHIGHVHRLAVG